MSFAEKFLSHIKAHIIGRLLLPFRASFGEYAHALRPEEESRLFDTHLSRQFQANGFQRLILKLFEVLGMSSR